MSSADGSAFVYVTYIRTTPEKLWSALTDTDFMQQYWFNMRVESDLKKVRPGRSSTRTAASPTRARFSNPSRLNALSSSGETSSSPN